MAQYALLTGSSVVNGQIVPTVRSSYYDPRSVGPIIQGVPASPPQSSGSGGSGMSDQAAQAGANPWSPVKSPVPWLIGMFVIGYLLLRHVHWGY